jgi:CheY-like chemotaxis protein
MKSSPPPTQNILLVDDNRDGLLVRRCLLEEAGYHVTEATNGEDGLKLFELSSFDVVVTDYRMPKMDGIQLIERIRKAKPDTRIVLLSGFVDPLGLTEANTGADVVLVKGAGEAVSLVRSVKRLLNAANRKPPGRQGGISRSRANKR